MKDKVRVVFSEEQYQYLQSVLHKCTDRKESPLSALAGTVLGSLKDCSTPNNRSTQTLPENSVVSDLHNDHAADVILCLLDEYSRLERSKALEQEEVPLVNVPNAIGMLTDKAIEVYGGEVSLDEPIIGVFDNGTIVMEMVERDMRTIVTADKPLHIHARIDMFHPVSENDE